MPEYSYIATMPDGRRISGTATADSRRAALSQLQSRALCPLQLEEQQTATTFVRRIPKSALAAVYGSLADLLESGVPLIAALDTVQSQCSHAALKSGMATVRQVVADGQQLADSLKLQPQLFGELAPNLVRAGEQGGFLEDSLRRTATLLENEEEVRARVVAAMAYPAFLMLLGAAILIGMVIFFIPQFAPLFDQLREQGELPWLTIALLTASEFIRAHWVWLGILSITATLVLRSILATRGARRVLASLCLKAYGLGPAIRQLAIARFCRVLGTLQSNGVALLRSLQIAREAMGNIVIEESLASAELFVAAGGSIVQPIRESRHFPPEVLEMIAVGEQSNRLDQVLIQVADKLERRAQRRLDTVVKLLEPGLMLVMAILIGMLVVALLLPVFDSTGTIL